MPWQVAIVRADTLPDLYNAQFCGGSVRDALHVITAAHCVADPGSDEPSELRVVAGVTDLKAPEPTMQQRGVAAISSDPDFRRTPGATIDDAAVLTLDAPLELNASVAALPPVEAGGGAATGLVSGWGSDVTALFPSSVQFAVLNILPDSACSGYGADFDPTVMICAGRIGAAGTATDTCHGDSGGPLTRLSGSVSDALLGITSFGRGNGLAGCGDPSLPGIYTRVANPAINAFLTQPDPPQRPANTSAPTISGLDAAGSVVGCAPGAWTGGPALSYEFRHLRADENVVIERFSAADSYRLTARDVSAYVTCTVRGVNAGGSALAASQAYGPVEPTAAAGSAQRIAPRDRMRPTSRFARSRCVAHVCTARLSAADDRGLRGLTLRARLTALACRSAGCRRAASRPLRDRAVPAVGFDITTSTLPAGDYRLTAWVTDAAGNRQAQAARVRLRVR